MLLSAWALFAVSLGYGVVVPLMPALTGGAEGFGLSLIFSLYSAARVGAQVPGGVWVDQKGPSVVLQTGLALFTVSTAGFLIPGPMEWFIALRVLEGLGTGLVFPAVFARVFAMEGSKKGTWLGLGAGLSSSGAVVGPVLGGLLLPIDVRLPVAIVVLVSAGALALSFSPKERSGGKVEAPRTLRDEVGRLTGLATNLGFVGIMLPLAFNKLSYTGLQAVLPLHAATFAQVNLQGVTAMFAGLGVTFGIAAMVGGWVSDRYPARPLIAGVVPLALASLAATSFATGPWAYATGVCAYAFFSSVVFGLVFKYSADTFGGPNAHGGVYGVLGTLTDLMTVLGPLLFVNAYSLWPRPIYAIMSVVGAAFFAGFLVLSQRVKAASAE